MEAYEAATDELDKAEAFNFRESVEMPYRDLLPALEKTKTLEALPVGGLGQAQFREDGRLLRPTGEASAVTTSWPTRRIAVTP